MAKKFQLSREQTAFLEVFVCLEFHLVAVFFCIFALDLLSPKERIVFFRFVL